MLCDRHSVGSRNKLWQMWSDTMVERAVETPCVVKSISCSLASKKRGFTVTILFFLTRPKGHERKKQTGNLKHHSLKGSPHFCWIANNQINIFDMMTEYNTTVDGWNPAPVEVGSLSPLFTGFWYILGGWPWDFFHQQYDWDTTPCGGYLCKIWLDSNQLQALSFSFCVGLHAGAMGRKAWGNQEICRRGVLDVHTVDGRNPKQPPLGCIQPSK